MVARPTHDAGRGPATKLEPGHFSLHMIERSGALATAALVGELDLFTSPRLHDDLSALFDQGVRSLTLDLSRLEFIDSTGLAELVQALRRHRASGGDVVLRAPAPATAKVLEISGLDRVFTVAGQAA
jgi:anti-sigma B factor antagonist